MKNKEIPKVEEEKKENIKSPGFQAKDLNLKSKHNLDELELKQLANIKQLIQKRESSMPVGIIHRNIDKERRIEEMKKYKVEVDKMIKSSSIPLSLS